ncbi:MAG TPA: FAD-dependent oxidoreductase [Actinomycetota bacterium]|nr:FAD-dependent oxidoreductase [Actinomycetota bacterium]
MPRPGPGPGFWLEEALLAEPGAPCPPLRGRARADVCIVGGGFAGLWTAIELIEREPSMRIALLEAGVCGGGASGRNGGFFSSSWHDLPAIVELFGRDEGVRYALALADEVTDVGRWCAENGVDAWYRRKGVLGVRTGTWQEVFGGGAALELCEELGLDDRIVALDAAGCRAYVDSPRFVDGTFTADNATVQPARLARGLRRVALERGVHIFEATAARPVEPGPSPVVRAADGAVRADQVILTHGSWAASWPGFRRSFGVIADFMVATEPIPERLERIGWTTDVGVADGRELLFYLRRTADHRIAIGGGATGVVYAGRVGRRATHDRRVAEVAARGLLWLFPQLEGVRFTHAWGGPIDHTAWFLPFFRTLAPGNVHVGLGFSGHGLAQTRLGGRILASLVLGVRDGWSSMPVVGREIALAPPEPLRFPLVRAAAWGLESGDRREDAGRPRGALRRLIGDAPGRYRDRVVRRGVRAQG